MVLMDPCLEPQNSYQVLELIDTGRKDEAKLAFVHYVLDVRDGFDVCNGQLVHIKDYVLTMQKSVEGSK